MDFTFNNIRFGTVGFIDKETKKSGWMIVFSEHRNFQPPIKELINSIDNGDEKYNCYSIQDNNKIVEKVKSFSHSKSIQILTNEYDSTTSINEALVILKNIYLNIGNS